MIYNLAYGKNGLKIDLPDSHKIDFIEPRWVDRVPDQMKSVTEALRNPYDSRPLKEIVRTSEKVGIIFSDSTRATPYNIIMPPLLHELRHIPQQNITFFCANGTHRLVIDEELFNILGRDIVQNYRIIQNESDKAELYRFSGKTVSGNDIYILKDIFDCDVKILTGFIEPHIFAGFSGGGKALIPGMAAVKTIKYNHSINHLSIENIGWGITDGNVLWEEIMEAAGFVPGLFLLNVALNKRKEITGVFAGNLRTAHKAGCKYVKESAMVPVSKLYDIVITTNSGFPLDLNIYQSVKGMSAAAQIVKPGGNIIIAAECPDGIPLGSDYEKILESVKNPQELMKFIKVNEPQLKDTWQIYFQALIQQKATVYLYSDKLDDFTIRKALFNPVASIEKLVKELVRKTGSETLICILPEGPQTIPYKI